MNLIQAFVWNVGIQWLMLEFLESCYIQEIKNPPYIETYGDACGKAIIQVNGMQVNELIVISKHELSLFSMR